MPRLTTLVTFTLLLLVVAVSANAQPPTVSTTSINLSASAGSSTAVSQDITASYSSANAFSTSVLYFTTTGWLSTSVSPSTATTTATITVSANPAGLAAGNYRATMGVYRSGSTQPASVDVVFSVGGVGQSGSLTASPYTLGFYGQIGVDIPPSQTITVSTTTGMATTFTAQAITNSGGNWLSVFPTSSVTTTTIQVNVSQAGLAAGTYTGYIVLASAVGNVTISVSLTATGGSGTGTGGAVTLSPSSLSFGYQTGGALPSSQPILVSSTYGAATYTASAGVSWLRVASNLNTFPTQSVVGTAGTYLYVSADPTGLTDGSYYGSVTVFVSGYTSVGLTVNLTVGANASTLIANPTSLSFNYMAGSYSSTSQNVTVSSSTGAAQSFTVSYLSSGGWLTVTPISGSTAYGNILTVNITPYNLTNGTYSGSISIVPVGASTGAYIPVTLNVGTTGTGTGTGYGTLIASPSSLSLTASMGGATQSQSLTVSSNYGLSESFYASATSNGGWLTVTPTSATTPTSLLVTANPAVLSVGGTYTGSITLTSLTSSSQQSVPVTLVISGSALTITPSAMTFQATSGGTAPASQTVTIQAGFGTTSFSVGQTPSWLTVNPAFASTPATLTVSVSPANLSAGAYSGTVYVNTSGGQSSFTVSFNVAAAPQITASPSSLTFNWTTGLQAPATQSVALASGGVPSNFTVAATAQSGGNWLNAVSSATATPATLTVSITPAGVPAGRHNGTIAMTPSTGPRVTVDVLLIVTAAPLPVVSTVLNAASLSPTPISPGLIIVIGGTNMGPTTGILGQANASGMMPVRLGETQVWFDTIAAPLLFVRNDQINAVVPYEVYGRSSIQLRVEAQGQRSDPIEMRVVRAAPGVFTADGSGKGFAAALNENGSANGINNRAARNSVVVLFVTGEGQTDPPGETGRVVGSDLKKPLMPVVVKIGGILADVLYAGSAPGMISGAMQVNVVVPPTAIPSAAVQVQVEIGGGISQSICWVSIQ